MLFLQAMDRRPPASSGDDLLVNLPRAYSGAFFLGERLGVVERLERTEGIEPPSSPGTGAALPLSYIRDRLDV
jgi:hypothetical protein